MGNNSSKKKSGDFPFYLDKQLNCPTLGGDEHKCGCLGGLDILSVEMSQDQKKKLIDDIIKSIKEYNKATKIPSTMDEKVRVIDRILGRSKTERIKPEAQLKICQSTVKALNKYLKPEFQIPLDNDVQRMCASAKEYMNIALDSMAQELVDVNLRFKSLIKAYGLMIDVLRKEDERLGKLIGEVNISTDKENELREVSEHIHMTLEYLERVYAKMKDLTGTTLDPTEKEVEALIKDGDMASALSRLYPHAKRDQDIKEVARLILRTRPLSGTAFRVHQALDQVKITLNEYKAADTEQKLLELLDRVRNRMVKDSVLDEKAELAFDYLDKTFRQHGQIVETLEKGKKGGADPLFQGPENLEVAIDKEQYVKERAKKVKLPIKLTKAALRKNIKTLRESALSFFKSLRGGKVTDSTLFNDFFLSFLDLANVDKPNILKVIENRQANERASLQDIDFIKSQVRIIDNVIAKLSDLIEKTRLPAPELARSTRIALENLRRTILSTVSIEDMEKYGMGEGAEDAEPIDEEFCGGDDADCRGYGADDIYGVNGGREGAVYSFSMLVDEAVRELNISRFRALLDTSLSDMEKYVEKQDEINKYVFADYIESLMAARKQYKELDTNSSAHLNALTDSIKNIYRAAQSMDAIMRELHMAAAKNPEKVSSLIEMMDNTDLIYNWKSNTTRSMVKELGEFLGNNDNFVGTGGCNIVKDDSIEQFMDRLKNLAKTLGNFENVVSLFHYFTQDVGGKKISELASMNAKQIKNSIMRYIIYSSLVPCSPDRNPMIVSGVKSLIDEISSLLDGLSTADISDVKSKLDNIEKNTAFLLDMEGVPDSARADFEKAEGNIDTAVNKMDIGSDASTIKDPLTKAKDSLTAGYNKMPIDDKSAKSQSLLSLRLLSDYRYVQNMSGDTEPVSHKDLKLGVTPVGVKSQPALQGKGRVLGSILPTGAGGNPMLEHLRMADRLTVMMIQNMGTRIFFVIGLYDMIKRPAESMSTSLVRTMLGGADEGVKVHPERLEAYIRVPLFIDFYYSLFDLSGISSAPKPLLPKDGFKQRCDRYFTIYPGMDNEFAGLFRLGFIVNDGDLMSCKQGSFDVFSDVIREVNYIYDIYKKKSPGAGASEVTRAIIKSLVRDINKRYGLLTVEKYREVKDDLFKKEGLLTGTALTTTPEKCPINPGEIDLLPEDTGKGTVPSDSLARTREELSDAAERTKIIATRYSLRDAFCPVFEFRERLDDLFQFSSPVHMNLDNARDRRIKYVQDRLARLPEGERLPYLFKEKDSILGCGTAEARVGGSDLDLRAAFIEFLVNPLLNVIVQYEMVKKVVNGVSTAIKNKNIVNIFFRLFALRCTPLQLSISPELLRVDYSSYSEQLKKSIMVFENLLNKFTARIGSDQTNVVRKAIQYLKDQFTAMFERVKAKVSDRPGKSQMEIFNSELSAMSKTLAMPQLATWGAKKLAGKYPFPNILENNPQEINKLRKTWDNTDPGIKDMDVNYKEPDAKCAEAGPINIFNNILNDYLEILFDKGTRKIYGNLISGLVNGTINASVLNPTAAGTVVDGVLLVVLKSLAFTRNPKTQEPLYIANDASELPPYMLRRMKAVLPAFINELSLNAELCGYYREMNGFVDDASKFNEGVSAQLFQLMDVIQELKTSALSTLRSLGDSPRYMESVDGKVPEFAPLSMLTLGNGYFFDKGTKKYQRFENYFNTRLKETMPKDIGNAYLYATRGVFSVEEREPAANVYRWHNELLGGYNAVSSPSNKIAKSESEYIDKIIIRLSRENRHISICGRYTCVPGEVSANSQGNELAALMVLLGDPKKPDESYEKYVRNIYDRERMTKLYKNISITDVVERLGRGTGCPQNVPKCFQAKVLSKGEYVSTDLYNQVENIIRLNIPPVDVNQMMREIPISTLINDSYNFQEFVNQYLTCLKSEFSGASQMFCPATCTADEKKRAVDSANLLTLFLADPLKFMAFTGAAARPALRKVSMPITPLSLGYAKFEIDDVYGLNDAKPNSGDKPGAWYFSSQVGDKWEADLNNARDSGGTLAFMFYENYITQVDRVLRYVIYNEFFRDFKVISSGPVVANPERTEETEFE